MIERTYTYTVSHCSKAIEYGLIRLLSELDKNDLEKGCILAVGKGNFCDKTTEVYKEGLGEAILKKLCENGHVIINGKQIDLQYPLNMSLSSVGSVLAIYPPKRIINKIEENIAHIYRLYEPNFPPNLNAQPRSLIVIPWSEFDVDDWITKYNPKRIDIDCADYYKYGSGRK